MWNRRKNEEEPVKPAPASTAPAYPEPAREGIPVSTFPARSFEPETPRGTATIGKSVLIKGQIVAKEDLVIDGTVEGTVEAHDNRVTIGPNGRVVANVKGRDVVVVGTLKGNIEASGRVDIRKGANLVGDIRYAKISIEEGADLRGSLEMIRVEAKPEPKVEPAPVVEKVDKAPERPVATQQTLGGAHQTGPKK
jgi:cytoskeletal protein CcmA (bactofilin family)